MDDYKVSICPRNDIFYVSWINKYPKRLVVRKLFCLFAP